MLAVRSWLANDEQRAMNSSAGGTRALYGVVVVTAVVGCGADRPAKAPDVNSARTAVVDGVASSLVSWGGATDVAHGFGVGLAR